MAQLVKELITQVSPGTHSERREPTACKVALWLHMCAMAYIYPYSHTYHIHNTYTYTKHKVGVKRSLRDQEHLLFLYKTWLLLPAPTQHLTTIYNLSSVAPILSSASRGHQTCKGYNWCTCRQNIHSHKKIVIIYFDFDWLISDFPRQGFSM